MTKVEALKKVAVALGYGSEVSEYTGDTVVGVLKELAVKMECATSTDSIRANTIVGVLNYIADNYGSEAHEPFDLVVTNTNATVTVKRKNKTIAAGSDILFNGDVLKITATVEEGYDLTTLTVNGETIESGDTFTVNGGNVTIVATGTEHVDGGEG